MKLRRKDLEDRVEALERALRRPTGDFHNIQTLTGILGREIDDLRREVRRLERLIFHGTKEG